VDTEQLLVGRRPDVTRAAFLNEAGAFELTENHLESLGPLGMPACRHVIEHPQIGKQADHGPSPVEP
jgi:hypothetical protein